MVELPLVLTAQLHARPAAAIARAATAARGGVLIVTDGRQIDATSVLELMAAALPAGARLLVVAEHAADVRAVLTAYASS